MGQNETDYPHTGNIDEVRAVWNANAPLRFAAPLIIFNFLWATVVPDHLPSWLLIPDLVMFSSGILGTVVIGTWISGKIGGDDGSDTPSLPSVRVGTVVWSFSSQSDAVPPAPSRSRYCSPREQPSSSTSVAQKLLLQVVWTVVLLSSAAKVGGLLSIDKYVSSLADFGNLMLAAILLCFVVVHETIHALVAILAGCRVSVGIVFPYYAYCRHSGAFLTRWDRIRISLAPNVVITFGAILLIVYGSTLGDTIALLALVLTMLGGGMDIHSALTMLRETPGKLWYIPPNRQKPTLVYKHGEDTVSFVTRLEERLLKATNGLKVSQQMVEMVSKRVAKVLT